MFSKGQLFFLVFFVIIFIIGLIWSYRKDIAIHKKYYKWTWLITLIAILIIFFTFRAITYYIHD